MLIIAATVPVRPERLEEAKAAATEMARASRAEAGCLEYGFYQDVEDPARIHIFERWESLDALRAHFQTAHMAEFQRKVPDLVAGDVEATRYEIADSGPVLPES